MVSIESSKIRHEHITASRRSCRRATIATLFANIQKRKRVKKLCIILIVSSCSVSATEHRYSYIEDGDRLDHLHTPDVRECYEALEQQQQSQSSVTVTGSNKPSPSLRNHHFTASTESQAIQITTSPQELTPQNLQSIQNVASCVLLVGQLDPDAETVMRGERVHTRALISREPNVMDTLWNRKEFREGDYTHAEDRQFEAGKGGNRVVFMNGFLQTLASDLHWKLRHVAELAIASAAERNAFRYEDDDGMVPMESLGVRCVELLEYTAGMNSETDTGGGYDELGWHVDADSVYTMVIMLNDTFEGGSFRIYTNECDATKDGTTSTATYRYGICPLFSQPKQHTSWRSIEERPMQHTHRTCPVETFFTPQGSGVLFNSSVDHGVSPITRGKRRVLVVEFWRFADSTPYDSRPATEYGGAIPTFEDAAVTHSGFHPGCDGSKGVYQRSCWG